METELITISEYCVTYSVEPKFIGDLEEAGLIVLTIVDDNKYIHFKQLEEMERFIHFHYDLQINIAGIEAIVNLLQKVKRLQHEIEVLKTQVHLHEPGA